jgi:ATP-dependent DNA helicase RecG
MELKMPIAKLDGIGPTYVHRLSRLGLQTIEDLINHFPFRYEDLSKVRRIAELQENETVTIRGEIWEMGTIRTRSGRFLTKATIQDGSGVIQAVWFNQPFLTKVLKTGRQINLAGKVSNYRGELSLVAPDYEIWNPGRHTGRIVAVYSETEGLSSKWLRTKIATTLPQVLSQIEETLPQEVMRENNLIARRVALQKIHLPANYQEIKEARKRLGFEEVFTVQLAAVIRKKEWRVNSAPVLQTNQDELTKFLGGLPFNLTNAQRTVMREILTDLSLNRPMNRMLMGEVGSGKTVVAAAASITAHANGRRTVLMAPTEILAAQHYQTLSVLLNGSGVNVSLHTGSRKSEPGDILVGTQALLTQGLNFDNIGLVIIDEQHRFGVSQRAVLREKAQTPHLLTMTATPIPRTLALTMYGDLDLSVIEELPEGRQTVQTRFVPSEKRNSSYQFIREEAQKGRQIFVVTPLIDPSESLSTLKSAKEEFRKLSEEVFPDLKLGLLHGRLKSKEKDQALLDFRDRKFNILVTTPVVEVGIDIPNATIMMIEGSERFGLAQLHQLRGRVGRGKEKSWCFLFTEDSSPETVKRLLALQNYHQGAKLAEIDLKARGPGEIYGLRQSGLPDFRIARLDDTELISSTRQAAENYLKEDRPLSISLKQKVEQLNTPSISPD